jgi:tetratricopeptide (TPR) repeat protein
MTPLPTPALLLSRRYFATFRVQWSGRMSATPDSLLAARPRLGAEGQAIASRVLAVFVADAPLAYSYGNLAILYGELERFDDALRYSNRAMKIFDEKRGSSSGDLGRAHHSRADLLQRMGKAHWPEAVEDYQAALVIFADAGGEFARNVEQIEEEVAKGTGRNYLATRRRAAPRGQGAKRACTEPQ